MDEMSMIRGLLAEPPPPPNVVAEGRERLFGSPAGAIPTARTMRRKAIRGALALSLTAATVALVVAALVPGVGTTRGGGGHVATEGPARAVLLAAAVRAE